MKENREAAAEQLMEFALGVRQGIYKAFAFVAVDEDGVRVRASAGSAGDGLALLGGVALLSDHIKSGIVVE